MRQTGPGARVDCFPGPQGPSPLFRRVGVRDITFEACSSFTHVTAYMLAQPPIAAFVTGFNPDGYPAKLPVSYSILSTTIEVEPSSTGNTRLRGALNKKG